MGSQSTKPIAVKTALTQQGKENFETKLEHWQEKTTSAFKEKVQEPLLEAGVSNEDSEQLKGPMTKIISSLMAFVKDGLNHILDGNLDYR